MAIGLMLGSASMALAQIDPYPRSLLQLGYDQSLSGRGPQSHGEAKLACFEVWAYQVNPQQVSVGDRSLLCSKFN